MKNICRAGVLVFVKVCFLGLLLGGCTPVSGAEDFLKEENITCDGLQEALDSARKNGKFIFLGVEEQGDQLMERFLDSYPPLQEFVKENFNCLLMTSGGGCGALEHILELCEVQAKDLPVLVILMAQGNSHFPLLALSFADLRGMSDADITCFAEKLYQECFLFDLTSLEELQNSMASFHS